MKITDDQQTLPIEAEQFTEREKWIIARLREYYTIDREIRVTEAHARGDNLPIEPSVTATAPRDDDPIVRRILKQDVLPTEAKKVVDTIQTYVSPDEFRYAATYRVVRRLSDIKAVASEHEERIQMALKLLRERYGDPEEYLELTDTERLAIKREAYIQAARERLPILLKRKRIIGETLNDLQRYYPEWWTILWYKYVLGKSEKETQERAARNGVPLTPQEYRTSRRDALHQFDKWAVGLC
ncbi:hypothetical protein [Alicyclobacillus suci]|uniref:hypothetical protein n=1 Tax=Alicyclobacillus suci TaxID=2816080 RepID=UPI001A8E32AD|nr:hypothetical protein [Alicyclobacillus suci]